MLFSSYNSSKKSKSQSQSHLSLFKPNGSSSFYSNSQFKRVRAIVFDSNTPTRRQVEVFSFITIVIMLSFKFFILFYSFIKLWVSCWGNQVVYNLEERINKLADEVDKEAPLSRLTLFSPYKVITFHCFEFKF